MKNSDVARAWARGQKTSAPNFKTDGRDLYSYNLRIGYTVVDEGGPGYKVALDFTAGGRYVSQTTSTHVGLAKRWADEVLDPDRHVTAY